MKDILSLLKKCSEEGSLCKKCSVLTECLELWDSYAELSKRSEARLRSEYYRRFKELVAIATKMQGKCDEKKEG